MQIILLNDHILIASRKKRKVEGANGDQRQVPSKLIADRCWPLLDIEIVDLAGTSESTGGRNKVADAIMIRGVGQESFTYRTEKPADGDKPSLMMNYRKAVEELRKGLRSEMESSNKAKETINYFASRDPGLLKKTELLETLSDIKDMLIEVDGKQQNLRWVEGEVDELDINIALQNFDEAVDQVEKLNKLAKSLKSNAIAQDFIAFKAEERATKLAGLITRELVDTHNNLKKTKRSVSLLARLGFEDRAREAYLEARSDIIHRRSRQVLNSSLFYVTNNSKAMHFRGKFTSVYLGIVFCLLHYHPEYRLDIPNLFPTTSHECMCQMGKGTSGCIQRNSCTTIEQHRERRTGMDRVYESSKGACKDAVGCGAGL